MVGLGRLVGADVNSVALAVSADGSVVLGWSDSNTAQGAFIWDAANGMRELDQVLIGLGLDLTGWTLEGVSAIFNDGLTIVGYGRNQRKTCVTRSRPSYSRPGFSSAT